MRRHVIPAVGLLLLGAACGRPPATAPTPPAPAPPLPLTLTRTPLGTGVQWGTTFIFDVTGQIQPGATFVWRFGDNVFSEGPGPVSHVYSTPGSFTASVEVTANGQTTTASTIVAIKSLLGTWHGTITGHTNVARGRPPLASFTLTVFRTPNPADRITTFGSTVAIDGLWTDNAGCRVSGPAGFLAQTLDTRQIFGLDQSVVNVSFGLEQFACNGDLDDLTFIGAADADFNVVSGRCSAGGPDCRFQMTRQ